MANLCIINVIIMEPVTSTTFIDSPLPPDAGGKALHSARKVLLNRLFLGYYDERRHVTQLQKYRDVITVSPAETELLADLDKIRQKLIRDCGAHWVGITGPQCEGAPIGHHLWVKLTNIPFGHYWFQIKQIKYEDDEIMFRLKCIRPVRAEDPDGTAKDKAEFDGTHASTEQPSDYSFDFDPRQKPALLYALMNDVAQQVKPHMTWNNFVFICKFIVAVGIVVISAMLTFIQYLGDYFLKLIREFTLLLHVLTPILIQAIDSITKMIGGFFILITLMFRSQRPQQLIRNHRISPKTSAISQYPAVLDRQTKRFPVRPDAIVPSNS